MSSRNIVLVYGIILLRIMLEAIVFQDSYNRNQPTHCRGKKFINEHLAGFCDFLKIQSIVYFCAYFIWGTDMVLKGQHCEESHLVN